MTQTNAQQYPYRMNSWCDRLMFAADVDSVTRVTRAYLGKVPAAITAPTELTNISVGADATVKVTGPVQQGGRWNNFGYDIPANHFSIPWGCGLTVTAGDCVIFGRDYLGQPIEEAFSGPGPTAGSKAFALIEAILDTSSGANTVTIAPNHNLLGLPFAAASTTQTGVTLNARDDAQADNTSNDPRGTITFDTPPDGSTELTFDYVTLTPDTVIGLHGSRHYASKAA